MTASPTSTQTFTPTPTASAVLQLVVLAPSATATCISCNPPAGSGAPAVWLNKQQPKIRAQGDWIVFAGEMASHPSWVGTSAQQLYEMQNGWWFDVWLTNPSGTQWYDVTNYTASASPYVLAGALLPAFSPDGTMLAWSEIVKAPDSSHPLGYWQLFLADFSVVNGVPQVTNIRNVSDPNGTWYEIEDWSPDSRTMLVSSDINLPYQYGMDLFAFDTQALSFTNLTNTPDQWDEQASYSPTGARILRMSTSPNPPLLPQDATMSYSAYLPQIQVEMWLMNPDGSGAEELTGFNYPLPTGTPDPEYQPGQTIIARSGQWNASGTQVILPESVLNGSTGQTSGGQSWLITFQGQCG